MFSLVKALFFGAIGLVVVVPLAIVLAMIGLPIAAVLGLVALPVLLVLFLVGLPFLIIFAVVIGLLGAAFGVVMAFLSVGAVALKFALMILVPLLIVTWILRRLVGSPARESYR